MPWVVARLACAPLVQAKGKRGNLNSNRKKDAAALLEADAAVRRRLLRRPLVLTLHARKRLQTRWMGAGLRTVSQ